MDKNLFENSLWTFVHISTFLYPENPTDEDKIHFLHLLNFISYILPCKKCKTDYRKNIDLNDYPFLNSKKDLIIFFINFHNKINKRLNKKEYSYEEVKEYYENIIKNSDMLKDKYNNN